MSVEVVTFGCRLNAGGIGGDPPRGRARPASSNTVVVNTCAVTAEAVRQARQAIRKLRRERPDARIVVTGCAAQTEPDTFAAMREVDARARQCGETRRRHLGACARLRHRRGAEVDRQRHHGGAETAAHLIDGLEGRTRGVRAGAERLRSSLHLLHHSVWPRQFALGADGRRGRRGAAACRATAIARSCSPASISPAMAPTCRARRGSARW